MKPSSPALRKAIFQIRYAPELDFCERMIPVAKRLSDYPGWKRSGTSVTLRDFKNHCSLSLESSSLTYNQDSGDIELERARVERVVEELPTALNINKVSRIGYRRFYLMPMDMQFAALVMVLGGKLFSQEEDLRTILPSKVKDFNFIQEFEDGMFHCNLHITPAQKSEIPGLIQVNFEDHFQQGADLDKRVREVVEGFPDVAIFIDIDIGIKPGTVSPVEMLDFMRKAKEKNQKLAEQLGSYFVAVK